MPNETAVGTDPGVDAPAPLVLDFCGERHVVPVGQSLVIGRDADVAVDDNKYLHRQFLEIRHDGTLWWLANIGSQLSATISDEQARLNAWLAPGAQMPLVFERTIVRFTAGPTSYEMELFIDRPPWEADRREPPDAGSTTVGQLPLTASQRQLIVALAEPLLRQEGRGTASIPSSADAAERLGWALTRFNRKLDNVCQKLARAGVRGLHGGPDKLASNRRARLVEYSLAVRLVTSDDLAVLDLTDGSNLVE
jgi:hypothetical protein